MFLGLEMAADDEVMKLVSKLVHRKPEQSRGVVLRHLSELAFGHPGGVPSADGVVYTLDVENAGVQNVGLAAEDVTVTLAVPAGTTVVTATGAGHQGVRRDEQPAAGRGGGGRGGAAAANGDVAVWEVSRIAPQDRQTYTLTLSQAATATANLRGTIRWTRPTVRTGPSDSVNIAPAPLGAQSR